MDLKQLVGSASHFPHETIAIVFYKYDGCVWNHWNYSSTLVMLILILSKPKLSWCQSNTHAENTQALLSFVPNWHIFSASTSTTYWMSGILFWNCTIGNWLLPGKHLYFRNYLYSTRASKHRSHPQHGWIWIPCFFIFPCWLTWLLSEWKNLLIFWQINIEFR